MFARAVNRLRSGMAVMRLRMAGAEIGNGFRIGRSRIRGRTVRVGDGVRIGDRTNIEADRIDIASHVTIEDDVDIRARNVSIGEETLIESGVTIGGLQTAKSAFSIGANCVVLHRSYLNTTYPLIIEDDVGVGGYCMIFTHGLWQSAFEGYPVAFGPVKIRRGVWLPWHVFVMPGVEIGEGATIGAGSIVNESIPPRSLAVGVPARVVKAPPNYPSALTKGEMAELVHTLLENFAEELGAEGVAAQVERSPEGMTLRCALGRVRFGIVRDADPEDIELLLNGSPSSRYWLDLLTRDWNLDLGRALHRNLRTFVRRMGVRVRPRSIVAR